MHVVENSGETRLCERLASLREAAGFAQVELAAELSAARLKRHSRTCCSRWP